MIFSACRRLLLLACELRPNHIFKRSYHVGVFAYVQNYQLAASIKMRVVYPINHRRANAAEFGLLNRYRL
jgi:hypothetical protein